MVANYTIVAIRDGNGALISGGVGALDQSGTGVGPWNMASIIVDGVSGINRMQVDASGRIQQNLGAVNGQAVNTGTGVSGTGTQRVAVSSDSTLGITGTVTVSGTITANQGSPPWLVGGDVASGSSDSGNPVKIGGLAKINQPASVTDGQRVNGVFDKQGKLIAVGAIRALKAQARTVITASTSETTIVAAGGAGVFNDLYGLILANESGTGIFVDIRDATAGTIRASLYIPANDTRGFMLPVDSAIPQTTAANNWTATCSASISSMVITALTVANS